MPPLRFLSSLLLSSAIAGCASTAPPDSPRAEGAAAATAAPRSGLGGDRVRVFEAGGAEVDLDRLLDAAASADALFLGETHNDDITHQVELALLEGLLARTGGKVVLSLEMFERDVQPVLDDYLAGRIDEAAFLSRARPWGNYATAYRPLVETAKRAGIPVVAANFPAPLRMKVAGGAKGWESLTEEERRFAPRDLRPSSAAYWARVDRAVRGHGAAGPARTPEERIYEAQSLWDNAMGEAVADAAALRPDSVVLHVVGGFHVQHRDGTVAQARLRAPGARFLVCNVWPAFDLAEADGRGFTAAEGDFVAIAAARASDRDEGRWSVEVGGGLRYRIAAPHGASETARAPLLVWLGPDGDRDEDGLAWWKAALGDAAAVVSVDPLHLSEEENLLLGGRWYWNDTFSADASRVQRGLERLLDYVTRRFPVDGSRVVVAGRGTGATALLWAAMYTQSIRGAVIAAAPQRMERLRMAGLPDGPSSVARLELLGPEPERLRPLAEEYSAQGIETRLLGAPGPLADEIEARVRDALGLPARDAAGAETRTLHLSSDTPTARRWAELHARSAAGAARIAISAEPAPEPSARLEIGGLWSVDDLRKPGAIPPAEGPFGGTTLVVVPKGGDVEAWKALAAADPLQKRSRFHRLLLAFEEGGPSLAEVLAQMKEKGRKNVLIVPGCFCADGDRMRALRAAAGPAAEEMTVQWLPGLGGRLATLR